jgi:plastocyanin
METTPIAYLAGLLLLASLGGSVSYGQSTPDQVVHGTYVIDIPAGAYDEDAEVFYSPDPIAIPSGTTVVWFNDDPSQIHTVTSGAPADEDAGSEFGSGFMQEGAFFQHTFNEAGEFPYFCTVHPWMVGEVTVSDARWTGHHFSLGMGTGAVFNFTKNERTLFSFEPTTIEVNDDAPVNYRFSIMRDGEQVFSEDFLTLGGNLQVELVPTDGLTSVYGPDVSDPVIGAYHIEGSFLKVPGDYKVIAEITIVAGQPPETEIGDEFEVQIIPELPVGTLAPLLAGLGALVAIRRYWLRVFGSR